MPKTKIAKKFTGQSAFARAVDLIRRLISSGRIVPGGRLPSERKLAEEYGLSRSSVREAIRSLAEQGILETRRGAGTYLASGSGSALLRRLSDAARGQRDRVVQVFEFRRMLEPQLVRRAVANATPAQLAKLRDAVDRQEQDVLSGGTGRRQDRLFHRLLAEATGNPLAVEAIQTLATLFDVPRARHFESPERDKASLASHQRVLAAIENRDAELAAQEMDHHLWELEQLIVGIEAHDDGSSSS